MKYLLTFTFLFVFLLTSTQILFAQQTFEIATNINPNPDLLPSTTIPRIMVEFVGKDALDIKTTPKFNSKSPKYGKVILGNSINRQSLIVVMDETVGQTHRVFVDENNNGDLTDDRDHFWAESKEGVLSKQVLINVSLNENGTEKEFRLPYKILRYENPINNQVWVIIRPDYLREGKLNLGDQTYKFLAQTYNKQGLFSDPKEITLGIDRDQDGMIDDSLLSAEVFWGGAYGGKPFNIGGITYYIAKSSISGDVISLAVSKKQVAQKNYVSVGRTAPKFSFKDLFGKKIYLDKLKNKVILLDFWATWCVPCVNNLPKLKKLTEKFSNEDFVILGISMDGGGTNEANIQRIKNFVNKQNLKWNTSFENQGMESNIGKLYNIVDLPLYIIIDKEGVIQLIERGMSDEKLEIMENKIQALIENREKP